MDPLSVQFLRESPFVVFELSGRLDGNGAPVFSSVMAEQMLDDDKAVIVDIHALEFVSSAGLRELLNLAKRLNKLHCKAVLVGISGSVGTALEIAGFSTLFLKARDVDSAKRLVAPPGTMKSSFLERFLHRKAQA